MLLCVPPWFRLIHRSGYGIRDGVRPPVRAAPSLMSCSGHAGSSALFLGLVLALCLLLLLLSVFWLEKSSPAKSARGSFVGLSPVSNNGGVSGGQAVQSGICQERARFVQEMQGKHRQRLSAHGHHGAGKGSELHNSGRLKKPLLLDTSTLECGLHLVFRERMALMVK